MKKTIFAVLTVLSFHTYAKVDLSSFELTPEQIRSIRKIEATGKRSEQWLLDFAATIEHSNIQRRNHHDMYIPPFTQQLIFDIQNWAVGGSFSSYANEAGVTFDGDAYNKDCPDWAVFNFGRATGTKYLKADVLQLFFGESYLLGQSYAQNPENFKKVYLEEAKRRGFDIYIK